MSLALAHFSYFKYRAVSKNTEMATKKKDIKAIRKKADAIIEELLGGDPCAARNYLTDAIVIEVAGNTPSSGVEKIFEEVGSVYGITKKSVGASINKYVKQTWNSDASKLRTLIFGNTVNFKFSRPTASKFITAVAYYIRSTEFPDPM